MARTSFIASAGTRLCFVLALGGLFACAPPSEEAETPSAPAAAPRAPAITSVETIRLTPGPFQEVLELVGETAPVRSAAVASEAPGRIIRLEVEVGDRVSRGDTLVRVDTSTQSAQVEQLRAQRRQAEVELERARALQQRGLGTQAQIDQFTSQIDILDESINQVRVGTRQAVTRAPIAGVITQKMVENGEYASPGSPLLRIADLSTISVHVGLPEREITAVREGMTVDVRVLATNTVHEGVLHRIGVEANPASRTFPLEVRIPNEDGALRGGMRATVIIEKNVINEAVIIPRDAVLQNLEGREVFIVRDGHARRQDVQVGAGRLGWVVALSGVQAGDELVVRGQRALVNGENVSTVLLGECCAAQLESATGPVALAPADPTASNRAEAGDGPTAP